MRRIATRATLAALCALLALSILSGCGAAATNEADYTAFDAPFVMTATYTAGHLTGALVYRGNASENFSLEYLSPDSVASLKLTNAEGAVTSEFLGIVSQTQFAELSSDHPLKAISGCIAKFCAEKPEPQAGKDGRREYNLSDGGKLVFANGVLCAAEMPAQGLSLKVTGFDV